MTCDRQEILDLVTAYASLVDRRDYEGVARLFADDASFEVVDGTAERPEGAALRCRGGSEVATTIERLHAVYDVTTHFLGQHSSARGGGEATAETYCMAHHLFRRDGARINRVLSIRYLDRLARRDGRWLFSARTVMVDWVEFRPATALAFGATLPPPSGA